jgi:hypothetical protein
MTSFTSDIPTAQIIDKLHDLAPSVPDLSVIRDAADPVVDRVNDAFGRSSSRPSWRWIIVGAVGILGVVALVGIAKRRRAASQTAADEQPVRLAS